ncbi:MAG TPA: hypothetical protein VJR90_07495 [Gammaproteobacteria bacterium]|nr:hypothetical protein [Gammaproteobacteria bacterium]
MHKPTITITLLTGIGLALGACVTSPYGDGYPAGGYSYAPAAQYQAPSPAQAVAQAAFTAAEIAIMQQYFQNHPGHQTQGDNDQGDEEEHGNGHGHGHGWKSREGGLPPGIAKNLARGKPLPPGIAAQLQPLPPELVQQLPRPPAGYQIFMLDGRILLVNMATQVISDVIANAILGH